MKSCLSAARISAALILIWIAPGSATAQSLQTPPGGARPAIQEPAVEPDFSLVVLGHFDGDTLAEFRRRVSDYRALRQRLEQGLPPLVVTENADDIERFERTLASRLRRARSSKRGQLFTPAMARQVKRLLESQADPVTLGIIEEDGPTRFDIDINDTYSKERPLATMPVKFLLLLPDLPEDLEYRFVGRHLILRDRRANAIIDDIPKALPCVRP